jgi:uncharacterized membrane protein
MRTRKDSLVMSRLRKSRDERGAILVMSTIGFVLAILASALAVDLGRLAQERRRDQKVADLAALDAVRELGNGDSAIQAAAAASALRNQLPAGATITAFEGLLDSGACVQQSGTGQVCVTVSTDIDNAFRPGGRTVQARALAQRQESAGFTIGSSLATANLDTELPILNGVMNGLLRTSGTVNLVSWQGIAAAYVNVRELQTALGFGTLDELLTTDITAGQLIQATSTVLNNQGTVASLDAATKLASLAAAATNTATFKLGDYLTVAQGYEGKALDGNLNVMQLIVAGAQLANKNNFVDAGSVINLPVTLPAPLNTTVNLQTKLGLKVIEGPQTYIGPVGGSVSTSQVELTLTPRVDVNFNSPLYNVLSLLSIIGTSNLRIYGDMPVTFTAAGATGTLTDVRCASPEGITVGVTTEPITTRVTGNLSIYHQTAGLINSNIKIGVSVQPPAVSTTPGGPFSLDFAYPGEFTPSYPGKQTPGAPAGVNFTTGNIITVEGAAGLTELVGLLTGTLKLDVVEGNIIGPILNPIFNAVADRLTTPALKALGLSIGPVDVTALADYFDTTSACSKPVLVG